MARDEKTGRPTRPHASGAWRTALALALLAGLCTFALVKVDPRARGLDAALPAELRAEARRALGGSTESAAWMIVSDVETPYGRVVRLRPFLREVELRGADLVLSSGDARWETSLEPRDWRRLDRLALRAQANKGTLAQLPTSGETRWILPSPDAPRLVVETLLTPPNGSSASRGADAIHSLPWSDGAPFVDGPFDASLSVDPSSGRVLEARDARIHAASPAVSGQALVFDPNPIRASGDDALRDGMEVDPYRVLVELEGLDASGRLRGQRVNVSSMDPVQAEESGEFFAYSSRDPRFEETMAYYHGTRSFARAEERGFRGLFPRPISLVVHATALDNSWYSRVQRGVFLGDGGVDDAEDADVILHETAHAIHDALVPGFGGGDTPAISEGFADFWAASITDDPCFAEWDATSIGASCLRRVDEPATFPDWIVGQPHHDGEVWSGLLWDLRHLLGAEIAERLALAALIEQGPNASFPDAGRALVRAAQRLGLDVAVVEAATARRGLVPQHIDTTLPPGGSAEVALLQPARILGIDARMLKLDADGTIHFIAEPAGNSRDSETAIDPTAIRMKLFGPRLDSSLATELSLHLELRFAKDEIRIEERWLQGDECVGRLEGTWSPSDGKVSWSYLESAGAPWEAQVALSTVRAEQVELSFLSLASPKEVPGGFHVDLSPELPEILGARFTLESSSSALWLRRDVAPMRESGVSLLLAASPNPFRERTSIRLKLANAEDARLEIFDAGGRRLRRLHAGALPPGVTWWEWDGRDDHGHALASGVYFVRASAGRAHDELRLIELH